MRIEYIRDGLVEEFHEGTIVHYPELKAINNEPYYLRSCAKPLQASLLIDYGINLDEDEMALCCGSHAGEECHIKTAKKLLNKFELDENMLKCGIHAPLSRTMQDSMLLREQQASAIHNNCSGKHIGFLILCKLKGWNLENYFEPEHPLQIAVKNKINELCEVNEKYPITTDGCGVPIVSMPLKNMLLGYKNLMKYPHIVNSILNNPYVYGGENRLDTEIIEKTDNIIAKVGAGGLCIIFHTKINQGFAIKIDSASMPARRLAALEMINQLGWGKIEFDKTIKTISGKIVGNIEINF